MNKEIISQEFAQTYTALGDAVALFDAQNFNQIPYEGSWTAGQVAQHLKLANGNFAQVLNGDVADADRPIDQKIPILKDIFLNFQSKLQSPDFIKPQLVDYDREQMLAEIISLKQDLLKEIGSLDLSKECLSFEMPRMGRLTRLEAIYFIIYHTQRHTIQLQNIAKFLKLS